MTRNFTISPAVLVLSIALLPGIARAEVPRLEATSSDGNSSIRFRLAAQIQWAYSLQDQGPGKPNQDDNSIFFRRIRPVIGGSLFTRDFTYLLHINLVPGSIELIDLWANYRFHAQFQVFLGQGKIPYTRYRLGSWQTRPVADWSYDTWYFGAERQLGVMFHNDVSRPPRWEYQLGVYTGVNVRASNGVGMARTYNEPRPNPSDLTDPAAPSSFHPEVVLHVAYNHAEIDTSAPQDWTGGPARFSVGLSAAWDARPAAGQDMSLRLAPEAIFKIHGFTLWGVFHLGFFDEIVGSETMQLGMLATMAQASFVFLERYEIGLRYANVMIRTNLREDARAYADQQIAEAEDEEARTALEERHRSVGRLQAEHEVLLGFNVYFFDTMLKLQLDGGVRIHERIDGDRYDMLIRTQVQLAF